jgi:hypothetical protein
MFDLFFELPLKPLCMHDDTSCKFHCMCRQVNAHLKKALGKTSMCNYENFMHTARFVVREHNAWCIAKVEKALELKSRANGVA